MDALVVATETNEYEMRARKRALADIAHQQVNLAVRRGEMPPASSMPCADCGGTAECYEHRDYRRAFSVEPVCGPCNARRGPALPWAPRKRKGEPSPELRCFPVVLMLTKEEHQRTTDAAARYAERAHIRHLPASTYAAMATVQSINFGMPSDLALDLGATRAQLRKERSAHADALRAIAQKLVAEADRIDAKGATGAV